MENFDFDMEISEQETGKKLKRSKKSKAPLLALSAVEIDAPDLSKTKDEVGIPAQPGTLKLVKNGVNFLAPCKKCKKDNIANIGEWDGSYVRMIRHRICKAPGCGGEIDHQQMRRMFFKNCRYTFSGIYKKTDEEFSTTKVHKSTKDSWWHVYDRESFIQYTELNVKVEII
jgi:hypothetical protein